MLDLLNKPFVKYLMPLLGTAVSAMTMGAMHPVTLSVVVAGVAVNLVVSFAKKK